jgi:L-lactate dehydrogenase complex protein LldF
MSSKTSQFKARAQNAVHDQELRIKITKATGTALLKRKKAVDELPEWETLRRQGHEIRKEVIGNIDRYIRSFTGAARRNGVIVHYADEHTDATKIIYDIIRRHSADFVVKSKSMITEELHLNEMLEDNGIRVRETDLGEYIVQLAHERPSHITAPALHKSKEDIAKLFQEKLGIPYNDDPAALTAVARERLRNEFLGARVGISGVNFACADTGTLAIIENEANARMCTVLPDVHIAVMSIEKIIPSVHNLPLFLTLLTRSASGQRITSYVSMINGPRSMHNPDGPRQLHVVILDGGRKQLAQHPAWKEALYCIRCGACMNVCPIYQTVGGHAYGSVYPGPIGSVITPTLFDMKEAQDLPFASSLCGACTDICPVGIDLHHHLLRERREVVSRGYKSFSAKIAMAIWRWMMLSPGRVEFAGRIGRFIQRLLGKHMPAPGWTPQRRFPAIASRSFRSIMKRGTDRDG